jgi:nucleoporin SEH1
MAAGREAGASEHGATALSWSDCPFEAPKLVVGGYSRTAAVWTYEDSRWRKVSKQDYMSSFPIIVTPPLSPYLAAIRQEFVLDAHGEAVHDVAWAPSMGRSYHLIATAGRGNYFKVARHERPMVSRRPSFLTVFMLMCV